MWILEQIRVMLYVLPAMLAAITFHEFAHGFVSSRLGDPTPGREGRLSLNPFRHLDPLGTLSLLFFHMGWAKPVRINTRYYKNKKAGIILVSAAGPAANLLLAFVSVFCVGLLEKHGGTSGLYETARLLFYYSGVINVGLAVFNLIPLPPLDGSNILMELIPGVGKLYRRIRPYSQLILVLLLLSGLLSRPLSTLNSTILNGMWSAVVKILRLVILPTGGAQIV